MPLELDMLLFPEGALEAVRRVGGNNCLAFFSHNIQQTRVHFIINLQSLDLLFESFNLLYRKMESVVCLSESSNKLRSAQIAVVHMTRWRISAM